MTTLICICSKYPNPLLHDCIDSLYKNQIKNDTNYKICVIDSDSSDFSFYEKVKTSFPEVELMFVKNTGYEYGAWKKSYEKYPSFDNYFCIHDTIIWKDQIDLTYLDDTNAFTFYHNSGYYYHQDFKERDRKYLNDIGLDCDSIIDTDFTIAKYCSFIVNNHILSNILKTFPIIPTDKKWSCSYERLVGLFFIINKINTVDVSKHSVKTLLNRQ
jgi:hypothetical protein